MHEVKGVGLQEVDGCGMRHPCEGGSCRGEVCGRDSFVEPSRSGAASTWLATFRARASHRGMVRLRLATQSHYCADCTSTSAVGRAGGGDLYGRAGLSLAG